MEININKKDFIKSYKLEGNKPSSSSYINQKVYEPIRGSVTRGLSGEGSNLFSVTKKDFDTSINRDDVLLRKNLSEEDLNRERAENQSAIEQLGNFVAQAVGSEVVVGTALGLSNMVDFFANIGIDAGEDDYTNPVSKYLEDVQENIRERFEIYRKDPNATWAIGDFGWWADNFISVASTASMLLPTLGITKGLSLAGKGFRTLTKMGKLSKGVAKMANKVGMTKYTTSFARKLNAGAEITTNALLSRTMEGYLEAREVYKSVYDETLANLKEMSNEERNRMFKNNPELLSPDMSDEEIASRISSVSADETFRNDYAMLLFDMAQFKGISNIWKGTNKINTAGQRLYNRRVIKNINGEAKDALEKIGFVTKQKEAIKHIFRNPLTSLSALELSEGIEEGYQGIQTEKGKEVAKRILDPNFRGRSLDSYITDPAIWEQAFWGVLGGVGFQALGKGFGKLEKVITESYDKNKLSEQDFKRKHISEDDIVKSEIDSRLDLMNKYTQTMEEINDLKNPLAGKINSNGEVEPDTLTQKEAEMWKEQLTSKFVSEMVLNSADAGTWDLFKEFVTSKEFAQYFQNNKTANGISNESFVNDLINSMDNIYEQYANAIDTIYNSIEVESPYVASLLGRDIVKRNLTIDNYRKTKDKLSNILTDKINNLGIEYTNEYAQADLVSYINRKFKELDKAKAELTEKYNEGTISENAYNIYIDSINREKNRVQLFATNRFDSNYFNVDNDAEINDFIEKVNDFSKDLLNPQGKFGENYKTPTSDVQNIISQINQIDDMINNVEFSLPKTQEDYQREYNDLSLANDSNVIKRYNESVDKINNWLESQEDVDKAKEDLLRGNLPENLLKDAKILKLGHHTTQAYLNAIDNTIKEIKRKRKKEIESAKQGNINGQNMSEETTDQVREIVEEQEAKGNNETPPSTGKTTQTSSKSTKPSKLTDEEKAELEKQIKNAKKAELESQYGEQYDPDRIANISNTIKNSIKTIFNSDESIKQGLIGKDSTSEEAKVLYDKVKQSLADNGDLNPSDDEIWGEIRGIISRINIKYKPGNQGELQKAAYSLTDSIEESELNKAIEDFIKKYIIARTGSEISNNKDYKTLIDVKELFTYLLNPKDQLIDVETAKLLYEQLKVYTSNNYVLTNTKLLEDIELFKNALTETTTSYKDNTRYLHINRSSVLTPKLKQFLNTFEKDAEVTVEYNKATNNLSFKYNNEEIGYIALVAHTGTGDKFKLAKLPNYGFVYEIDKNNVANTDTFFNELIYTKTDKHKRLLELIIKDYTNKQAIANGQTSNALTESEKVEAANLFNELTNGIHANTANQGNIPLLLGDIQNVIFYDTSLINLNNDNDSKVLVWDTYKTWTNKVYHNYLNTYKIQTAVNTNKKVKVKLAGIDSNRILYDNNKQQDVNKLHFDHKKHPVIVNMNNNYFTEDGKDYSNALFKFQPGFMGFVIQDNPNAPIVAKLTRGNKISTNSKYAKNVKAELTNLLNNYQSGILSFDGLYSRLLDLLNSNQNKTHNLFIGYNVLRLKDKDGKNDRIVLNREGTKQFPLIIYKFANKNSTEEGTGVTYFPNGVDFNGGTTFFGDNKELANKTINSITDEIVSNLEFNKTFYPFILKDKFDNTADSNRNRYIYKKDGKLVININNDETAYDNFGEFIIKENAFKTNQQLNEVGGYFDINDRAKSLYVDIAIGISPVEGIDNIKTPINLIQSANENGVEVKELIEVSTLPQPKKDIITSNKILTVSFLPDKVYYNTDERHAKANAFHQDGKIYFTKKGSEQVNNPNRLLTLLFHESVHKRINELKGKLDRQEVVDEILKTYNKFIEELNKDTSEDAIIVKKWIADNNFTLDEYFNNLEGIKNKERYFAEEWIAESLSQAPIIRLLNKYTYSEDFVLEDVEDNNKSIFQKIIEILLKLFDTNSGNLKNNSILAKQYSILGEDFDVTDNTTENSIETEKSNDEVPGEPETKFEPEKEESGRIRSRRQKRNEIKNPDEDIQLSKTSSVDSIEDININATISNNTFNAFGVNQIQDMDTYIKQFPTQDQPLISKMVAENQIKFVC